MHMNETVPEAQAWVSISTEFFFASETGNQMHSGPLSEVLEEKNNVFASWGKAFSFIWVYSVFDQNTSKNWKVKKIVSFGCSFVRKIKLCVLPTKKAKTFFFLGLWQKFVFVVVIFQVHSSDLQICCTQFSNLASKIKEWRRVFYCFYPFSFSCSKVNKIDLLFCYTQIFSHFFCGDFIFWVFSTHTIENVFLGGEESQFKGRWSAAWSFFPVGWFFYCRI